MGKGAALYCEDATVGPRTLVEPDVTLGYRYHPDCGPARVGADGILRRGTIVYGDVVIGDVFQSGHYAVIRARTRLGDHCALGNHSTIEGIVRMGNGVRVMSHVYIPSRTWFGDNIFVGPGTTFLNDRYPGRRDDPPVPRGATIEDDVMIGGGVTVLPGIRIGRQSFIAAGTTVTHDVPERSLVIGQRGEVRPLPVELDRPNSRRLTEPAHDIWHPEAALAGLDWPEDWGESFEQAAR